MKRVQSIMLSIVVMRDKRFSTNMKITTRLFGDEKRTETKRGRGNTVRHEICAANTFEIPEQSQSKSKRGYASLMERKWICWRPRGRMVDSRLSRLAMDPAQSGSPRGLTRWAESRTAANSGSDSGVLTRSTHPGSLGIGQGESSGGCSAGL